MNLVIDMATAWLSLMLAGALSVVWLLKKLGKADTGIGRAAHAADRWLRKHHRAVGIVLIAVGLVHGLSSSTAVLSLNPGTILWVLSILLGATWLLRRPLRRGRGWLSWHRVLTAAFAGVLAWHVIDVGGFQAPRLLAAALRRQSTTTVAEAAPVPVTLVSEAETVTAAAGTADAASGAALAAAVSASSGTAMVLADGVYTGTATGFRPGLAVQVTVSGGAIAAVQVVAHNEVNERFWGRAVQAVPQEIVAAQTTNVDAVSGATFTSTGIINAVNNALSQALVSGTLPADRALPSGGRGPGGRSA